MIVQATVPMRIDLAGGTLDVYPLYLFVGGGITVNAAVSVHARVRVATREDARIVIRSEDLGLEEEIASLDAMTLGGRLDLAKRALAYYRPRTGVEVTLHSEAPAGSGLGASSALLMALSHCLNRITGRGFGHQQIVDVGANLEAQTIGIPTGKQDYFPPLYGGVCAIWFDVDGWRLEGLSEGNDLADVLSEQVLVSYTGLPHDSAVTNWAMLKAYIEREGDSVRRMAEIKEIALGMRAALMAGDTGRLAEMVDAEWRLRRGLAEGVTTPQIEAVMAAARGAGALANKICGAGGGGCMITVAAPGDRARVARAIEGAGARVLPARVVAQGLALEVE